MLITISGLPGSGTSTLSKLVAAALGIEHVDGGTVFRSLAAERGVSVAEFSAIAERDASIDVDLDARLAERARAGEVVLESRLAGWIATNEGLAATRIWVACADDERARRVAAREGVAVTDAGTANEVRERSERERYAAYYGIDFEDLSIYDLRLDSGRATPEELAATVLDWVRG